MPSVYTAAQRIQPTEKKIAISLPLTWETLCLIDALRTAVKNLLVVPQSSGIHSSLQVGAFPYLQDWGVAYFPDASDESKRKVLQWQPDILIDTCFSVGGYGYAHGLLKPHTIIVEETGTGVVRIQKSPVPNPYFFLDESVFKSNFENKRAIGQVVVAAAQSLFPDLEHMKIGVLGFGQVGDGIALALSRVGNHCLVSDIQPDKQAYASSLGYTTRTKSQLLAECDVIITATGREGAITSADVCGLHKQVIFINGGGDNEWVFDDTYAHQLISQHIVKREIQHCTVLEVCGGNSINLVLGFSLPEIIDLTFAHLVLVISELTHMTTPPGKNALPQCNTDFLYQRAEALMPDQVHALTPHR